MSPNASGQEGLSQDITSKLRPELGGEFVSEEKYTGC